MAKINKDLKADQQALKKLDKMGDQAIKQAEPSEVDRIRKADGEFQVIYDQSSLMSKHIFAQFKKAAKAKNMQLMNAAQSDFIGFNKYTDNVIASVNQAFKNSEWDKISKISSDFKSMVQRLISD